MLVPSLTVEMEKKQVQRGDLSGVTQWLQDSDHID